MKSSRKDFRSFPTLVRTCKIYGVGSFITEKMILFRFLGHSNRSYSHMNEGVCAYETV